MKKFLSLCMAVAILAQSAAALPAMPQLHAKSAVLMDSSGQILYQMNADEKLPPASVTKIMTMLLAMEAVDSGKVSLDDMVTGSANAASMGGTQIWLKEGEKMSLNDMLKCIAVASANDCAVAVAEFLGGSEASFVDMMNKRAKELGMNHTTFVNPNGLDADGQQTITSAKDIAIMSCELLKHPKIKNYTTIWMDTVRNGQFGLANTNKMLKKYPGMTGLKTGFTNEAKYCISATAQRDGMELIAAVMAEPTKEERNADVTAMLNYGFANYTKVAPKADTKIDPVKVILGKCDSVDVEMNGGKSVLVEKQKAGAIEQRMEIRADVKAPVEKGQELGKVVMTSDGKEILTIPIVAKNEVPAKSLSDVYTKLITYILMK